MSLAKNIAETLGKGKETRQENGSFVTCCPVHGDKKPSLSVKDRADGKGVMVKCFSGCGWKEVQDELVSQGLLPKWKPNSDKQQKKKTNRKARTKTEKAAWAIWKNRDNSEEGRRTVKDYFSSRSIELDNVLGELGFSRWNKKDGTVEDSIVARVVHPYPSYAQNSSCVHKTILNYDGKVPSKASTRILGSPAGKVVGFGLPGIGVPVEFIIGEGIETVLSASQATGLAGMAALTCGNLETIPISSKSKIIHILVDSDIKDNRAGQVSSLKFAQRIATEYKGIDVRLIPPTDDCFSDTPTKKDFNDLLQDDPTGELIRKRFTNHVMSVGDLKDYRSPGEVTAELGLKEVIAEIINLPRDSRLKSAAFKLLFKAKLEADHNKEVLGVLQTLVRSPVKHDYARFEKKQNVPASGGSLGEMADGRTIILLTPHEMGEMIDDVAETITGGVLKNNHSKRGDWALFRYGGPLSYVTDDYAKVVGKKKVARKHRIKVPVVKRYCPETLALRAEQSVLFTKETTDKKGEKKSNPTKAPLDVMSAMLKDSSSDIPTVTGLVQHPTIDADGRLITAEGYDEDSGLFLDFRGHQFEWELRDGREIPAENVLWLAKNLFRETSFDDDVSDFAGALALLLTTLLRKSLSSAPGFLLSASTQSTGKTELINIVNRIGSGYSVAPSTFPSSKDEFRKDILTALLQSPTTIFFDNILEGSEVNNPMLSALITSDTYRQRILGGQENAVVPTRTVFVLTGNNVTLGADLVSRFVTIRLNARMERPESKRYNVQDLDSHCLRLRDEVIGRCIEIVLNGLKYGERTAQGDGSRFKEWDVLIRQPLMYAASLNKEKHAEKFDVVTLINQNRDLSEEHRAMIDIMDGLFDLFGSDPFRVSDLMKRLKPVSISLNGEWTQDNDDEYDYLREAFLSMAMKSLTNTKSLAWVLKKLLERIFSGKTLKEQQDTSRHGHWYRIAGAG